MRRLGLVPWLLAGIAACAAEGSRISGERAAEGGGGDGSAAAGSGGDPIRVVGVGDDTTLLRDRACASEVQKGEPLPLSMVIMMDASGSMLDPTVDGQIKWLSIANAVRDFLIDPRSSGISVAISFFPERREGVPADCTTHDECGPIGGPCTTTFCDADEVVTYCRDASDCASPTSECVPMGLCAGDAAYVCPLGSNCGPLGPCVGVTGYCVNATLCEPAAYSTPTVAMTPLPGGANAIVQAMVDRTDFGRTPTGPALAGAIDYAGSWAMDHPDGTTVTVLATDGLPTECQPTDIADIAAIAGGGFTQDPSIRTFVIGVFGPDDEGGAQNLDQIAESGGTGRALSVDTSGDVASQFIEALDAIRGNVLSCEMQIPDPESGEPIDYDRVNVDFTKGDSTRELVRVQGPRDCAGDGDGWYYDVAPADGTPQKITVCPSACDAFKDSENAIVDLLIGCETRIR